MSTFLLVIVVVLVVMVVLLFSALAKHKKHVDEIYHMVMEQAASLNHHEDRLDAHFKDIVNLSQHVDALQLCKDLESSDTDFVLLPYVEGAEEMNLDERRDCFAGLRKDGVSVKDAGAAIGVSYTTAKRYERWRKDNKK